MLTFVKPGGSHHSSNNYFACSTSVSHPISLSLPLSLSQCSDAGETQIRGPSILSQALYHFATALLLSNDYQYKADKKHNCSYFSANIIEHLRTIKQFEIWDI